MKHNNKHYWLSNNLDLVQTNGQETLDNATHKLSTTTTKLSTQKLVDKLIYVL